MAFTNAEKAARYRARHPERSRESNRRCWEKHKEEYRAAGREWKRNNPPPKRSEAEQFVNQDLLPRFESHVAKSEHNCWLWTGHVEKSTGYGGFNVGGANVRTHRVAWLLYRGAIPDDLYVLHTCDVRHCVNPAHLFLGTHLDNIRDAMMKGRMNVGELCGGSKLTEREVRAVRYLGELGMSGSEIAPRFNITQQTVSDIVSRQTWREV